MMNELKKICNNTLRDLFIENGLFTNIPKQYEFFKNFLIKYYAFNENNDEYINELYNYYCNLCIDFKYLKIINSSKDWKLYIIFDKYAEKTNTLCSTKYWLARGYTEIDAKLKIKNLCSRSLESTIKKYGLEEGTKIYTNRIKKTGETFKLLYKQGKIDFSKRKVRNRLTYKLSVKPKHDNSLRYLFLDDNFVYTDVPKSFEYFSMFLISNYKFNKMNIEYLKILYNEYIKLCDNFLYTYNKINIESLNGIFPNYIRKCSILKKEHWMYRGYSEDEAKQIISNIQKNNTLTLNNAIKKYGNDLGLHKYNEYTNKISSIIKNDYESGKILYNFPYSKTINPITNEYYTLEECIEKRKEDWKNASKKSIELIKSKKNHTVFQKEFWISKGFSEEDAILKIYDLMFHNNYEYLIQKYGEKLGSEKYHKRIETYKKTINSKSPEEIEKWNLKRTLISHRTSKAATTFFEKCILELKSILNKDIIDMLYIKYNDNEYYIYDKENKLVYFYDYTDLKNNIIIEFNGIKFHPKYWEMTLDELKNWKSLGYHVDGITQMNKDTKKLELAIKNGFLFATVWEDQTFEEKMNIIKKYTIIYYDRYK